MFNRSAKRWLGRRLHQLRRYHLFLLIGYYVFALSFLGWGYTVHASWPGAVIDATQGEATATVPQIPGLQLLLLAPLLVGLLLSWLCAYPLEKAAHDRLTQPQSFPGILAYLALQARHNLLLIVPPIFLFLFEQTLFYLWPGLQESSALAPFLAVGLLTLAFVSIPLLLRYFLGLKTLPPCPLRDRLEAMARRLRFRFADVLVWDTRQTIANAMVTGLLPWMRYIVVTDRLIQELSYEEVEAVFAHEVGHVKHHHMLFYILFLLGSALTLLALGQMSRQFLGSDQLGYLLGSLGPTLLAQVDSNEIAFMIPLLALIAVYIVVVFGYISRRCERQADVYGSRATSCAAFIGALEKVAHLNGIPRDKPGWLSSWQHGTIAQRVAFLEQLDANHHVETRFQRRLGMLKWSMALGLAGVLGVSFLFLGPERVWDIIRRL